MPLPRQQRDQPKASRARETSRRAGARLPKRYSLPTNLATDVSRPDLTNVLDAFCRSELVGNREWAEDEIANRLLLFRLERSDYANGAAFKKSVVSLKGQVDRLNATLIAAGRFDDGELTDLRSPSASPTPDTDEVIARLDYALGVGTGARLRGLLSHYSRGLETVLMEASARRKPTDHPRYDLAYGLVAAFAVITGTLPNANFHGADEREEADRDELRGSENDFWRFLTAVNSAHRMAIANYCALHHADKPQQEVAAICDEFDIGPVRSTLDWAVEKARKGGWRIVLDSQVPSMPRFRTLN